MTDRIAAALERIAAALEDQTPEPDGTVLAFLNSVNPQHLASVVEAGATLDSDPVTATLDTLKALAARL